MNSLLLLYVRSYVLGPVIACYDRLMNTAPGIFENNLNQCIYQIVGLNYGMVLKANLKVVMYRYSRHVLKKSVCILMI